MDKKELRKKRQAILREIDRLEYKRCAKCIGSISQSAQMHCNCHAAKKIRKLGEDYNDLTLVSKQKRLDDMQEELTRNGISLDLYRRLREAEVDVRRIQKMSGLSQHEFMQWRTEHNLVRSRVDYPEPIEVRVQKAGLTVELYKQHSQAGMLDLEIRKLYDISETALYKFKKEHNLTLGRGMLTGRNRASGGMK